MFEKDHHVIMHALLMWANYIETGTVTHSANDLKNCGRSSDIKSIDVAQKTMVERLRSLASKQGADAICGISKEPAPETSESSGLSASWKLEGGIHICRVGKVKVAQILCLSTDGEEDAYIASGFMPGIPTSLCNHPALDPAKSYVMRAVNAWIGALGEACT